MDTIIKVGEVLFTVLLGTAFCALIIWVPYNHITPVEAQATYMEVFCAVWLFGVARRLILNGGLS